jgi:lactate permease
MLNWTQNYDPFHFWPLSTLVAALPIVVLFYLLVFRKSAAWLCALAGAATAVVLASVFFGMPWRLSLASFAFGGAFGVLKIAWIVLAAVYLYDISVATGQFEIMKESIAGISADRRLQSLLIAFCFGAFIEGAAGFGAPVAIAAAFMVGLGFKPFYAAALCLIANTAPVAWGAIGTPVHTLALVTKLPEADLNAMIGRILPFTSLIVPLWLVRTMVNWRETWEVMPAILVTGVTFGLTQFYWSNYRDSNLVDIIGAVFTLIVMVIFLHFWKPRRIWRFEDERHQAIKAKHSYTHGQVARAWMPFAILSLLVLLWGITPIKNYMNARTTFAFDFPVLHNAVFRDVPVVPARAPEGARYDFNWLSATGTACFLAAILSGMALGVGPRRMLKIFIGTLGRMKFPLLAIVCMLGLGYTTRYSGMDAVLGLAFTRTGVLYPFFGTMLGWLGVALTGSDTASNALFGSLQRITAEQLGISPVLMSAANSSGGVMGKMIDAQSIVVSTAATNQVGTEGIIFKFVFWHSVILGAIVGLIVLMYAYLFPAAIPHGLKF